MSDENVAIIRRFEKIFISDDFQSAIDDMHGGTISEVWTQFDGLGMMQQLGAFPE